MKRNCVCLRRLSKNSDLVERSYERGFFASKFIILVITILAYILICKTLTVEFAKFYYFIPLIAVYMAMYSLLQHLCHKIQIPK